MRAFGEEQRGHPASILGASPAPGHPGSSYKETTEPNLQAQLRAEQAVSLHQLFNLHHEVEENRIHVLLSYDLGM